MNQKHLKTICKKLQLGSLLGEVSRVYGSRGGSFLWRVNTEKSSYIIKQLAPGIDLNNEKIVTKYELSETIAYQFTQQEVAAVPAIEKFGKHLIILENIGYLVYPWIEGYNLGRNEISETHSLKIAVLLAKIHCINMSVPEASPPRFDIFGNERIIEAIDRAVSFQCPFAKKFKVNQNLILSMNDNYHAIIPVLTEDTIITHGDLDQLNVLWDKADQPILIDWESTRRMNPTRDVVRTSLSWSGFVTDRFSLPIYENMLRTYVKSGGPLNRNHINAALNSIVGSLVFWMLYNIELVCTCGVLEQREKAIEEVNVVLKSFQKLNKSIPDLLKISVEI